MWCTCSVAEPPRITTQPVEFQDVIPGKSVTFTIQVTGTKPLSYQWQWRPAGRGRKREEWQTILCDSSTFQEVDGGLKLTRVMVYNAGYYRCIVCNCAGSETSQSAKLTVGKYASWPEAQCRNSSHSDASRSVVDGPLIHK